MYSEPCRVTLTRCFLLHIIVFWAYKQFASAWYRPTDIFSITRLISPQIDQWCVLVHVENTASFLGAQVIIYLNSSGNLDESPYPAKISPHHIRGILQKQTWRNTRPFLLLALQLPSLYHTQQKESAHLLFATVTMATLSCDVAGNDAIIMKKVVYQVNKDWQTTSRVPSD